MAYLSLSAMKTKMVEKAQRKLAYSFDDYAFDKELLGDYFDEACSIIKDWKKKSDYNFLFNGNYDTNIVRYIIESVNYAGLEGQSSSSANGNAKIFIGTPESNLKKSIPQSI